MLNSSLRPLAPNNGLYCHLWLRGWLEAPPIRLETKYKRVMEEVWPLRYRRLAVLLALMLLAAFASPVSAARVVKTPSLELEMAHDVDGYKLVISVDPMGKLRDKLGVETGWFVAADNDKVQVNIDPIFVVGF